MLLKRSSILLLILILTAAAFVSCGGNSEEKSEKTNDTAVENTGDDISYVSEDISFGVFFDREGTKRTVDLKRGQKQLQVFIIVQVPEFIEIAAAQWQLSLPEGLEVDVDRYHKDRVMSLGQMPFGISERFKPCLPGPTAVIHELTLNITGELKNAAISILPSKDGNFLGIANCTEGFPQERASSYKAVVNPDN
ncbi:MAG: hypothetical protein KAV42_09380 [Candidatus Krumholzibacteria bacterium]|nr:hypothetical protein [Candidatus Krumholzibacteria bacterium]